MRVLLTGATGLIGCHTAARLLDAGHVVRVLVRDPDRLAPALAPFGRGLPDVEVARGDLGDAESIDAALAGCDGLIHAAGRFSPDRRDADALHAVNVEGTRRLFAIAREHPLERAIHVSSILALFPPAGPVMRAEDPTASPKEMYAATKAAADRIAREASQDRPVHVVYPAAVQGPDDPTFSVGPQLVADALVQGRVLVTEGGLPSTDVRDLARVLVAVIEGHTRADRLMGPAFFVDHADHHALLERITGRSLARQRIPGWVLRALGRLGDLTARFGRDVQLTGEAAQVLTRSVPIDDAEARRLLGGEARSAEESFRDLIRWMVAAGHLPAEAAGRAVD